MKDEQEDSEIHYYVTNTDSLRTRIRAGQGDNVTQKGQAGRSIKQVVLGNCIAAFEHLQIDRVQNGRRLVGYRHSSSVDKHNQKVQEYAYHNQPESFVVPVQP
ncbi:hypothetical protein D3C80_1556820 [compost metagenome]